MSKQDTFNKAWSEICKQVKNIDNKDFVSNYSNRTSSFIKIKKDKTNE